VAGGRRSVRAAVEFAGAAGWQRLGGIGLLYLSTILLVTVPVCYGYLTRTARVFAHGGPEPPAVDDFKPLFVAGAGRWEYSWSRGSSGFSASPGRPPSPTRSAVSPPWRCWPCSPPFSPCTPSSGGSKPRSRGRRLGRAVRDESGLPRGARRRGGHRDCRLLRDGVFRADHRRSPVRRPVLPRRHRRPAGGRVPQPPRDRPRPDPRRRPPVADRPGDRADPAGTVRRRPSGGRRPPRAGVHGGAASVVGRRRRRHGSADRREDNHGRPDRRHRRTRHGRRAGRRRPQRRKDGVRTHPHSRDIGARSRTTGRRRPAPPGFDAVADSGERAAVVTAGAAVTDAGEDAFERRARLWAQLGTHENAVGVVGWGETHWPWLAYFALAGGHPTNRPSTGRQCSTGRSSRPASTTGRSPEPSTTRCCGRCRRHRRTGPTRPTSSGRRYWTRCEVPGSPAHNDRYR